MILSIRLALQSISTPSASLRRNCALAWELPYPQNEQPWLKWLNRCSLCILWLHPVYFKLISVCVTAYTAPNWSLSRFVSWPWGTLTSSSCKSFGYVRAGGPSLFFPLWRLFIPPSNGGPTPFWPNSQGFSPGLPSHVPACCARFLSLSILFEEQSQCYTKEQSKRNI